MELPPIPALFPPAVNWLWLGLDGRLVGALDGLAYPATLLAEWCPPPLIWPVFDVEPPVAVLDVVLAFPVLELACIVVLAFIVFYGPALFKRETESLFVKLLLKFPPTMPPVPCEAITAWFETILKREDK